VIEATQSPHSPRARLKTGKNTTLFKRNVVRALTTQKKKVKTGEKRERTESGTGNSEKGKRTKPSSRGGKKESVGWLQRSNRIILR